MLLSDAKPPQPLRLVLACPERGIELPEAPYFSGSPPVIEVFFYRRVELSWKLQTLLVDFGSRLAFRALFDRRQQLVKRIGKQLDAVHGQLVGHLLHRDANAGQVGHCLLCAGQVLRQTLSWLAVIAESVNRGRRDGVDRVWPDQFLDIDDVTVVRILGAGAGPEYPLCLRAFRSQRFPARSGENLLVSLVGQLAIRDGNLAENALQLAFARRVAFLFDLFVQQRIHERVNAADEETGHTGHLADVSAARRELLDARDIGFRHPLINLLRKKQRDIDIDAFTEQLLNGGNPFRRSRHLDHHVLATDCFPQPQRFIQRALRVVSQIRRHFQAYIPIALLRALVDRPEQVGSVLNVANREQFITRFGVEILAPRQRIQKILVFRAAGDCLFENRGIGSHPPQAVFIDQPLQVSALEQIAPDVIEPDGLPERLQLFQGIDGLAGYQRVDGIHDVSLLLGRQTRCLTLKHGYFAASSRAACITVSGLNPNFFCKSLSGAEAPNVRIPITRPFMPT